MVFLEIKKLIIVSHKDSNNVIFKFLVSLTYRHLNVVFVMSPGRIYLSERCQEFCNASESNINMVNLFISDILTLIYTVQIFSIIFRESKIMQDYQEVLKSTD